MQPINRVLLILLIAGAGAWYWMKQQNQAEYDRQVGALASALDRRYLAPGTPASQAEAMFLRAIVIFSDYRSLAGRGRIRVPEPEYLKDSLTAAGYTVDPEIALVCRTLREGLALCGQLKISTTPEGTQALLTGQPPLIRQGPFKGDTLVLGRRVPAALAPDLANHPGNFGLIPSAAAALIWPYTLSDSTTSALAEFKSMNLLDPKTALDLKQRAEQLKAVKR